MVTITEKVDEKEDEEDDSYIKNEDSKDSEVAFLWVF